jgi:hypothetical protein
MKQGAESFTKSTELTTATMKKIISFLLVTIIFSTQSSCKKEESASCSSGYIYWGGDYAVDGLGFYFAETRQGNWKFKQLKESELPSYSKSVTDSTAVTICLEETDERAPCFCATPSYFYKIVSIERR